MTEKKRVYFAGVLVKLPALFGLLAGFAFLFQAFFLGMIFFACGLLVKLVNLPLSDILLYKEPIFANNTLYYMAINDSLYRTAAMLFNGTAFAGLLCAMLALAYAGKMPWAYPILLFTLPAAAMSVSLFGKRIPWVRPHSIFAKVRSGLISLPIAIFPVAVQYSIMMAALVAISGALILAETSHKAWYYSRRQPT